MSGTRQDPRIAGEKLIAAYHTKRVAALVYYILGVVVFIIGLVFMITSSVHYIAFTLVAWYLGMASLIIGVVLITWAELKRGYTTYIVTTWNVRIKKGYLNSVTTRVFYDEISSVKVSVEPEDVQAGQGNILIYTEDMDTPTLVFDSVHNPAGVHELISRFLVTIPDPVPWEHIPRPRTVNY
jgi:hypothetical protein